MNATDGTIFQRVSLDRRVSRWEQALPALTPVQQGDSGRWYKREDWFAPLGYGGINGAKLRQLVWLTHRARLAGHVGVYTAASVLSPQVSMCALVAKHFGLPATIMLGATSPRSSARHENVAIAGEADASFVFTKVAYNPALQGALRRFGERPEMAGWWRLPYGITLPDDATGAGLAEFHAPGAGQVANVPPVDTVWVPAGSLNSTGSLLFGMALHRPEVRRVVLVGIGPNRIPWLHARLTRIAAATGVDVPTLFRPRGLMHDWRSAPGAPYVLDYVDLHGGKVVAYGDRRPWRSDGIEFHPTYEGKVMWWLHSEQGRRAFPEFTRTPEAQLMWVVGSRPTRAAMRGAL